jgi:hypothetical protein
MDSAGARQSAPCADPAGIVRDTAWRRPSATARSSETGAGAAERIFVTGSRRLMKGWTTTFPRQLQYLLRAACVSLKAGWRASVTGAQPLAASFVECLVPGSPSASTYRMARSAF